MENALIETWIKVMEGFKEIANYIGINTDSAFVQYDDDPNLLEYKVGINEQLRLYFSDFVIEYEYYDEIFCVYILKGRWKFNGEKFVTEGFYEYEYLSTEEKEGVIRFKDAENKARNWFLNRGKHEMSSYEWNKKVNEFYGDDILPEGSTIYGYTLS